MPKPVCVPCQRFFRPFRNGVHLMETMPIEPDALPGMAEIDKWKPYKGWMGDLWKCQGCGAEIIIGFGKTPFIEDHRPNAATEFLRCTHIVNDC